MPSLFPPYEGAEEDDMRQRIAGKMRHIISSEEGTVHDQKLIREEEHRKADADFTERENDSIKNQLAESKFTCGLDIEAGAVEKFCHQAVNTLNQLRKDLEQVAESSSITSNHVRKVTEHGGVDILSKLDVLSNEITCLSRHADATVDIIVRELEMRTSQSVEGQLKLSDQVSQLTQENQQIRARLQSVCENVAAEMTLMRSQLTESEQNRPVNTDRVGQARRWLAERAATFGTETTTTTSQEQHPPRVQTGEGQTGGETASRPPLYTNHLAAKSNPTRENVPRTDSRMPDAMSAAAEMSIWAKGHDGIRVKPLPAAERYGAQTGNLDVWLQALQVQIERAALSWTDLPSTQRAEFIIQNCTSEVQLSLARLGVTKYQGDAIVTQMLRTIFTPKLGGTSALRAVIESRQEDCETTMQYVTRVYDIGQHSPFVTEDIMVSALSQGIRCHRDSQAVDQLITNHTMQHNCLPSLQAVTKHLQCNESLNLFDRRPTVVQQHRVANIREEALEAVQNRYSAPHSPHHHDDELAAMKEDDSEMILLKKQIATLHAKLAQERSTDKTIPPTTAKVYCEHCKSTTHSQEQCWIRMELAGFDTSVIRRRRKPRRTSPERQTPVKDSG
jgi:hypothetical protein